MVIKPEDVNSELRKLQSQQLRHEVVRLESSIDDMILSSFGAKKETEMVYFLPNQVPEKVLTFAILDYRDAGWDVSFDKTSVEYTGNWGYLTFKHKQERK